MHTDPVGELFGFDHEVPVFRVARPETSERLAWSPFRYARFRMFSISLAAQACDGGGGSNIIAAVVAHGCFGELALWFARSSMVMLPPSACVGNDGARDLAFVEGIAARPLPGAGKSARDRVAVI